jgi:hypothetical protein
VDLVVEEVRARCAFAIDTNGDNSKIKLGTECTILPRQRVMPSEWSDFREKNKQSLTSRDVLRVGNCSQFIFHRAILAYVE